MNTATTLPQWVIRITGATQVVLGILFWTGRAYSLLHLHMLIGATFVLALWVLAGLAARAGLRWRGVLLAVAWGLLVPVFGMMQMRLLQGDWHWIVEVTHLAIGVVAMIIADRLVRFIRLHPRPARAGRRIPAGLPQGG